MTAYTRLIQFDTRADNGDVVPATVSSETPVPRSGFTEVLVHSAKSIDLSRAPLPVVEAHRASEPPIAVVEDLAVRGRKLRGKVRFGTSARARELLADVKNGIVRSLSVGYEWIKWRDEGDVTYVDRWRPGEVSIVGAPADPEAGFYRSKEISMSEDTPEVKLTRSQRRAEATAAEDERMRIRMITKRMDFFRDKFHDTDPHFVARAQEAADRLIDQGADPEAFADWVRSNQPPFEPTPRAGVEPFAYSQWAQVPSATSVVSAGAGLRNWQHWGTERRAAEEAAFAAGQWFRAQLLGHGDAADWLRAYRPDMTRVMQGGIQSKGGAMVPEALSQTIINLAETYGVARQLCRVVPMSSDTLYLPRRTGGPTVYVVGEEDAITASDMSFDTVTLNCRKIAALTRVSSELAEDSVVDVADMLAREFALAFAQFEDNAFLNGDGTSTYAGCYGVLPKIIDGAHTAGAIDAASGHDTFAEIDTDDLASVLSSLPKYAKPGARWLVSPQANALIFQSLAVAAGGATMTEMGGVMVSSFWGIPIVQSPLMPTSTGDLSNLAMILLGDFSQAATLGVRRDIRVRVDESRYLEYDQLGVVGTARFDVVVHDLGNTTAAGPVVALVGE